MQFLIVGTGSIGERHLRSFLKIKDVHCSIAEVNPATRERICADYSVESSYDDYRKADLGGFDGVVICVPANLHVPIAMDVLKAGTHVLTEKPLAMSLEGIGDLVRLRDEKGLVVSVAFTRRSDPVYQEIKARADSNDLGTFRIVRYYGGQYWPAARKDYPPQYAQKRETGGGAIPDHLVHTINYLEWLFGPPEEVSAFQRRLSLDDVATEDSAFMLIRFSGGLLATLGICLFQRDSVNQFQIIADGGTIDLSGAAVRAQVFSSDTGKWKQGREEVVERDDIFLLQSQHFIDCIRGDAVPRCSVEEAEQTLRTVLAACESSDTDGRFVKVSRPNAGSGE